MSCLQILSKLYDNYKLSVNIDKTKSMIFNHKKDIECYPESIIVFQGEVVENVEKFNNLGSIVKYDEIGTGETEIIARIQASKNKFMEYERLFKNQNLTISTRMRYFYCFVRSRMTYGCQTWSLTKQQYDRLEACQRKLVRQMVRGGFKRVENKDFECEKEFQPYVLGSKKLMKLCKLKPISEFVKKQQIKYAAHIARARNDTKNKQLLFNDNKNHNKGRSVPNLIEFAANELQIDQHQFHKISRMRQEERFHKIQI